MYKRGTGKRRVYSNKPTYGKGRDRGSKYGNVPRYGGDNKSKKQDAYKELTPQEKQQRFQKSKSFRTLFDSREEWEDSLKKFLDKTLKPILPDNKVREKYLTPSAMNVWMSAFTHLSIDPRREYNYEVLEFLGDRALKYAFTKYISRRFPEISQDNLTRVETTYMSKIFQPKFARDLGLVKYTLYTDKFIPDDIQEDVFEAFIGALDKVSDEIEDGLGIINVFNFITNFFNGYTFDLRGESGNISKTLFIQIFDRFFPGREEKDKMVQDMTTWVETGENQGVFTIKATPKMLKLLESPAPDGFNIKLKSPILGQAKGENYKQVEKIAYQQALKTLRSYNITPETATALKQQRDFFEPSVLPLLPSLKKKLESQDLKVAYFTTSKQKKAGAKQILYLNAEDNYGIIYHLDSVVLSPGDDIAEAKKTLIEKYIAKVVIEPTYEPKKKTTSKKLSKKTPSKEKTSVEKTSSRKKPSKKTPSKKTPSKKTLSKKTLSKKTPSKEKVSTEKTSSRKKPSKVKKSPPKSRKSPKTRKEEIVEEPEEVVEEEIVEEPEEVVEEEITSFNRDVREKELQSMKIPELKEILKSLKLKVSGRKAELIERILEYEESNA
jgi:dsRNA-specific ribonuclease